MRCPFCHADDTRVIETRTTEERGSIRRRRECQECRRRFTTYEHHEEPQLYVIKKDGRRELFAPEKLMDGITRACEKRPISRPTVAQIVADIERLLRDELKDEVPSSLIGDLVMNRLRDLDEVAYVRFASVYKEFRDIDSFIYEIEHVISRTKHQRHAEEQQSLFDE